MILVFLACTDGKDTDTAPVLHEHGAIAEGIMGRLGDPIPTATAEQLATFERGKTVAKHKFLPSEGLGPGYNASFCAACHEKPETGGSAGLYRNFVLSGRTLEDGSFFFGSSSGNGSGVIRIYSSVDAYTARPEIPDTTTVFAQRNAIPFFGVGLLADVSDDEILQRADEDDADGNGISGRANYDRGYVGRFGMKAQTVSIEGFIRGPLNNQLGITSDPLTEDQRAALPVDSSQGSVGLFSPFADISATAQAAAPDGPLTDTDAVADPEMNGQDLFDLISFAMLLAAPTIQTPNAQEQRGLVVFDELGCGECHTPRINGPKGPLPVYSDLLLHDMGEELADGILQGYAGPSEFRTQPLWGVSAEGPYLHDGRAGTLHEAILWHGGEGTRARDAYAGLSTEGQIDLIAFLESLGGKEQVSMGLIRPDDPTPEVDTYGGPYRTLTEEEAARFEKGRLEFDAEFPVSHGAGNPRFNGDSCRACHFEPVFGGAGPLDVNVMRHAILNSAQQYVVPTVGTILHRETTLFGSWVKPQPGVNIYEARNTPHLFGLGLIEAIPESTILAHEDPYDLITPDGITGKASYTDGDRLGRFGWKAQVPTLAEFVRDAVAAELGMTLAYQDGLTFGRIYDNDDIADPEYTLDNAALILDYLKMLGPPPRQPGIDAQAEAAGEQLFSQVGCDLCHTPSMEGELGPVNLYSDLLLHEILPDGSLGIEDASASMTEFRTAPLWGLSQTGPYLHDGSAETIEQAILAHDGEALSGIDQYLLLTPQEQANLLAFLDLL